MAETLQNALDDKLKPRLSGRGGVLTDIGKFSSMAGRNLAGFATGIAGDIQSIVPGSPQFFPTSEEMIKQFGGDIEHPSALPMAIVAPGPGEAKTLLAMLKGALAKSPEALFGMTLFHASPVRRAALSKLKSGETVDNVSDIFDLNFIGQGEGAQAFGHGLYFGESPDMIKGNYLATFSRDLPIPDKAHVLAANSFRKTGASDDEILTGLKSAYPDASDDKLLSAIGGGKAEFFEVEIPDHITDKMLDWDKPLSEQNIGHVIDALFPQVGRGRERYLGQLRNPEAKRIAAKMLDGPQSSRTGDASEANWRRLTELEPDIDHNRIHDIADFAPEGRKPLHEFTGEDLYEHLTNKWSMEQASLDLKELGIPGIRYRAGQLSGGSGETSNIVVFDPDIITQVKRDGELVFESKVGIGK